MVLLMSPNRRNMSVWLLTTTAETQQNISKRDFSTPSKEERHLYLTRPSRAPLPLLRGLSGTTLVRQGALSENSK